MDRKYVWLCLVLISLLAFAGCGSGGKGGAPGSTDSTETGILIQAVSIDGVETAGDSPPDIDVNIHCCSVNETTGLCDEFEEGLFRVDGDLLITATALNPDTAFDPFPASVEQCSITYRKSVNNPDAPIITADVTFPNCPLLDGENNCVSLLFDIPRKTEFWNKIINVVNQPSVPSRYVASFTCEYVNAFGERGSFQTEYEILLADFDNC